MAKKTDLSGLRYTFEDPPGTSFGAPNTPTRWDPRESGCKCNVCPLGAHNRSIGEWRPVPPEQRQGSVGVIFGESPGGREVKDGRPFVGKSGWKLNEVLEKNGLNRNQFDIGNALACRPPGDDMRRFLAQLQRENKRRETLKTPIPRLPLPTDCCRPQFTALVRRHENVLLLGGSAYEALTSKSLIKPHSGDVQGSLEKQRKKAVQNIRGSFIEFWYSEYTDVADGMLKYHLIRNTPGSEKTLGPGARLLKVTPTWHPAFVLRSPEWDPVLAQDVGRFWRWINGRLNWVKPEIIFTPTVKQLAEFLWNPQTQFHAYDIETDGKDSLTCKMRCIIIATEQIAMVVPFLGIHYEASIDGWNCGRKGDEVGLSFYPNGDGPLIRDMVIRWLLDPTRLKVGHNSGYFDTQVLKRVLLGGQNIQNQLDNILLARANNSDLPRDLYTTGTLYTDVPDWKEADGERKIAVAPRSNEELWGYGGTDGIVTARCFIPMWRGAEARNQLTVVNWDHSNQNSCREMQKIGMHVDEPTRARGEEWLEARSRVGLRLVRDLLGDAKFNPQSTTQMRKLLYDDWKFPVLRETETGDPSTDDDCIRDFLIKKVATAKKLRHDGPEGGQVAVLKAIRFFREDRKLLGTYFRPARPFSMRWYEIDEETGKRKGKERHGWCMEDGRLHPGYNGHTPTTGRISSSKPMNAQNMPLIAKHYITAADGNKLVGADFDQIELRLFSLIAGLKMYLDEFSKTDSDPHTLTATLIYGEAFTKLDKKHPGRKRLRTIAKSFTYAVLYGASVQTIYETLSSAEDAKTRELLFPDLTLEQVRAIYNNWLKGAPEVGAFWDKNCGFAKMHGYVLEPVLGRRRDFPVYERNEILNFPIQGGAAAIMEIALARLVHVLPWGMFGPNTGLINQCHDAVTFEVPEARAKEVAQIVKETMVVNIPHMPGVSFTAKPDIGYRWSEV